MPRIANGFSSDDSLASSLSTLAQSFFGDQAKEEVNRQTAFGKQRENSAAEAAANAYRGGDLKEMAAQYLRAFRPAADAAGYNLLGVGQNSQTPGDMPLQVAQVAAREPYSSTRSGQDLITNRAVQGQTAVADRQAAQQQRQFENTFEDMQDPNTRQVVPVPRNQVAQRVAQGWGRARSLDQVKAGMFDQSAPRVQQGFEAVGEGINNGSVDPQGRNNIGPLANGPAPQLASLSPEHRTLLGLPTTPHNYVAGGQNSITYNGVTDARTNQPLPPGGHMANTQGSTDQVGLRPNVTGDLQKTDIAGQKLQSLIDHTRAIATTDPTNFGVTGYVKGAAQDITQMAGNVATGLGYSGLADAVNNVRQRAAQNGINPSILSGIYDPRLNALHTSADLLVFSAAEALAGQSGRSVTDKDVALFKNIVGNPQEWMTSQEKYLSKLDTIQQILNNNQAVVARNLAPRPGTAPAAPPPTAMPPAAPAQPAAPAPQQPAQAAQPAAPVVEQWQRGPDGRLQRVQ